MTTGKSTDLKYNAFSPPVIKPEKGHLQIIFPRYFRDQNWADHMGIVQDKLSHWVAQTQNKQNAKTVFDLVNCRWIDPLPLLSIILEITNAAKHGQSIIVRLPTPDSGPGKFEIGPYQQSPNRLLLYLNQEGFLDSLDQLGDKVIYYSKSPGEGREIYETLGVNASYEEARCLPMRFFIIPNEADDPAFAKHTVEELLVGIDSKLDSKAAPQSRERLTYKLRVTLQEALHNAQEHAYSNTDSVRLIAIYVRYRTGGLTLGTAGKEIYKANIKEERKSCPRLADDWLTARPGCLEVFILDRGIGLVESFKKSGFELTQKYKFKQVLEMTFLDGSSTKPERQTRYGGLHLLHNLLIPSGDYLRALNDGIWFGCGIPLLRKEQSTHLLTKDRARLEGLSMHIRLGWKEETDVGDKWAKFNQGEQSEVWPELSLDENSCSQSFSWFEKKIVLDERFGDLKKHLGEGDWILWLVRPHRMKWDILTFIENQIAPLATGDTILIIADIPSYEAETYAETLSEFVATGDIDWPSQFSKIILSTNRLRFAGVDYQKLRGRHAFSKLFENINSLTLTPPPIQPKPDNFRLAVIRWIKWFDSRLYWDEVDKFNSMFIPENVGWGVDKDGNSKEIQGYLDFHQTSHNNLCASVCKHSIARILGILPPTQVEMCPLDRLTVTVLREIHSAEIYEPAVDAPDNRIAIGSVLVSGKTLDSSVFFPINLHFFVHKSSPLQGENPSLLYWLPKKEVSEGKPRLSRIGKTATVAPDGWKSFEVPRFDEKGVCVGDRSPSLTYQDWQAPYPVVVKAGHWAYEGHHDFITINIPGAVEAAFLEKNDLARFLVRNIFPFLGINQTHVEPEWTRFLNDVDADRFSPDSKDKNGLLVYRSHPSTDFVIRRLLDILTPEAREMAMQRISPILPIRMRWSGSTLLIPPLVREDLQESITSGGEDLPVLIFDDAAVTGRTLNDLKTSLSSLGAKNTSTLVIANRLRQPSEGIGGSRLIYYWRLDLPVMGREGNCPLCNALKVTDSLLYLLTATNAKNEIHQWQKKWKDSSTLNNWSKGLPPLPLTQAETKNYCYRRKNISTNCEGKYLAQIELLRSTGLCIHISEIHAMTGRDDYCLKKISEQTEPEIIVEIAASQLLLFGSEFDIDIRLALVKTLIRELAQLKQNSPYTSLAVLTCIRGFGLLDSQTKIIAAATVNDNGWTARNNYATKVFLAYLTSEELLTRGTIAYEAGHRLLSSSSWPLSRRFKAWFLEILSPKGNAHTEAIPLLIGKLEEDNEIDAGRIKDAMDSLDHLADIVGSISRGLVRKRQLQQFGVEIEALESMRSEAQKYLAENFSTPTNAYRLDWRENTKTSLMGYTEAIKSVAEAFFHRIPSTQNYWRGRTFETSELNRIKNRIDWKRACEGKDVETRARKIELSQSGDMSFNVEDGEIWIAWHRGIHGIIQDLFRNAVYSSGKLLDPWSAVTDEMADMWVRVDYFADHVGLTLANQSQLPQEVIFDSLKKYRWPALTELGGDVSPVENIGGNIFGVIVRIPYAAYLKP